MISRIVGVVSCVLVVSCLLACGGFQQASARIKRSNDLKLLGIVAHNYHDSKGTFPPDQASFLAFAQQMAPEAVPLIQQTGPGGTITFHYGAFKMGSKDFEPQGMNGTVLASDSTIWPGNIRLVLKADGSVGTMTEAEFATAPKPKKADPK